MKTASHPHTTLVWITLVILTAITFAVGEAGMAGTGVMAGVLAVTLAKGQLVASHFMGLRRVRLMWRVVMASWLLLVSGLIGVAYLIGA